MFTFAVAIAALASHDLIGADGSRIGSVTLTDAPRGILVRVEAAGMTPGWHGIHLHERADCSDSAFKSSGGHVHGSGVPQSVHGLLNPQATDMGDMPNVHAARDGSVNAEIFVPNLSLGLSPGRLNLLDADGAALVIHADPDDHMTQPIGGAGARVACAELR